MGLPRWRASSRKVDHEIRRLRRWGIVYAVALTAVFVGGIVLTVFFYLDEVDRQERVNTLIATQPHVKATVFEVEHPDGSANDSIGFIRIDGQLFVIQNPSEVSLWDVFKGDDRYEVGDHVTVVIDPNMSDGVWNVEDRDDLTPWARISTLLIIWGALGLMSRLMSKIFQWRFGWRLPVPLRALRHFIRPKVAKARLVETRAVGWLEDLLEQNPLATLVVEINDRLHVWEVHSYDSMKLKDGMTFDVWGAPRLGGWVVGMTSPHKLYPRSPLD